MDNLKVINRDKQSPHTPRHEFLDSFSDEDEFDTEDFEDSSTESSGLGDEISPTVNTCQQNLAKMIIEKEKERETRILVNKSRNHLCMDDFYRKQREFNMWLEERGKDPRTMSSPKKRILFKDFLKLWNNRKLSRKYYRGRESMETSPYSPVVLFDLNKAGNETPNLQPFIRKKPKRLSVEQPNFIKSPFSTFGKTPPKIAALNNKKTQLNMDNEVLSSPEFGSTASKFNSEVISIQQEMKKLIDEKENKQPEDYQVPVHDDVRTEKDDEIKCLPAYSVCKFSWVNENVKPATCMFTHSEEIAAIPVVQTANKASSLLTDSSNINKIDDSIKDSKQSSNFSSYECMFTHKDSKKPATTPTLDNGYEIMMPINPKGGVRESHEYEPLVDNYACISLVEPLVEPQTTDENKNENLVAGNTVGKSNVILSGCNVNTHKVNGTSSESITKSITTEYAEPVDSIALVDSKTVCGQNQHIYALPVKDSLSTKKTKLVQVPLSSTKKSFRNQAPPVPPKPAAGFSHYMAVIDCKNNTEHKKSPVKKQLSAASLKNKQSQISANHIQNVETKPHLQTEKPMHREAVLPTAEESLKTDDSTDIGKCPTKLNYKKIYEECPGLPQISPPQLPVKTDQDFESAELKIYTEVLNSVATQLPQTFTEEKLKSLKLVNINDDKFANKSNDSNESTTTTTDNQNFPDLKTKNTLKNFSIPVADEICLPQKNVPDFVSFSNCKVQESEILNSQNITRRRSKSNFSPGNSPLRPECEDTSLRISFLQKQLDKIIPFPDRNLDVKIKEAEHSPDTRKNVNLNQDHKINDKVEEKPFLQTNLDDIIFEKEKNLDHGQKKAKDNLSLDRNAVTPPKKQFKNPVPKTSTSLNSPAKIDGSQTPIRHTQPKMGNNISKMPAKNMKQQPHENVPKKIPVKEVNNLKSQETGDSPQKTPSFSASKSINKHKGLSSDNSSIRRSNTIQSKGNSLPGTPVTANTVKSKANDSAKAKTVPRPRGAPAKRNDSYRACKDVTDMASQEKVAPSIQSKPTIPSKPSPSSSKAVKSLWNRISFKSKKEDIRSSSQPSNVLAAKEFAETRKTSDQKEKNNDCSLQRSIHSPCNPSAGTTQHKLNAGKSSQYCFDYGNNSASCTGSANRGGFCQSNNSSDLNFADGKTDDYNQQLRQGSVSLFKKYLLSRSKFYNPSSSKSLDKIHDDSSVGVYKEKNFNLETDFDTAVDRFDSFNGSLRQKTNLNRRRSKSLETFIW